MTKIICKIIAKKLARDLYCPHICNTQTNKKLNTMNNQKIFKLICNDFGHKFSFNAQSLTDAISKAKGYCRYHSFHFESEYKVEETTNGKWMHNEYVN